MDKYRLMLVDDEPWALVGLEEILDWEALGFKIVARCLCGVDALNQARKVRPDAVVTDIRMPDITGLQLIEQLRQEQPRLQSIIVSAYSDFEVAREAIRLATAYYVLKPFSAEELREAVELMSERLRRLGRTERQEEPALVQVEEKNPVFPSFEGKGRCFYLILADSLMELPERDREKKEEKGREECWKVLQIGAYFGILTDELPLERASGEARFGISTAFPDCTEAAQMIQLAAASLEGGFRFAAPAETGKSQASVAAIQLYLYEHLAEDISLGQLARLFFLTETYLCDLFKKQTGETVVGFLRRLRINRSKKLLTESTLSLGEIATRCGYKDYSYFGKQFKADVGMSPDLYRKQERNRAGT